MNTVSLVLPKTNLLAHLFARPLQTYCEKYTAPTCESYCEKVMIAELRHKKSWGAKYNYCPLSGLGVCSPWKIWKISALRLNPVTILANHSNTVVYTQLSKERGRDPSPNKCILW